MVKITAGEGITSKLLMAVAVCQVALISLLPMSTYADSCTPPSTTYGTDSMSLSIPTAGEYTIWTRLKLPVNSTDNLLLNVDNSTHCYNIGGSTSTPLNTWEWINYSDGTTGSTIQLSLSQGNHTIAYTGINSGVEIDRVEALAQTSCAPTGTGDNCLASISAPPSGGGTSSTGGGGSSDSSAGNGEDTAGSNDGGSGDTASLGGDSFSLSPSGSSTTSSSSNTPAITKTSSGKVQINAPVVIQATSGRQGVSKVEYLLNGKVLASERTYPYKYKLNTRAILNGNYTLTTKTFYTSGKIKSVSEKIVIKNPASFTQVRLTAQKYALPGILLIGIIGGVIIYLFNKESIQLPFLVGRKTVVSDENIPGLMYPYVPPTSGLQPLVNPQKPPLKGVDNNPPDGNRLP